MRKLIKKLVSVILVPLTRWYLRKERLYVYKTANICVLPGVFHPGLFSSTTFILQYLETQDLRNQSLLEIGSGTGLISVMAAKAGAQVTALDISEEATKNTKRNAVRNDVNIEVVLSDLFLNLRKRNFDWIIINPPYYARDPITESDNAWYCGKNFEYFQNLFDGLAAVMHNDSKVLMVLTQACDLQRIFVIGKKAGFDFRLVKEKSVFFDGRDFLYLLSLTTFDMAEV